jgi:beta-galactosidase
MARRSPVMPSSFLRSIFLLIVLMDVSTGGIDIHRFDLTSVDKPDLAAPHLAEWTGTSPDGRTIAANRHHLTLDGKPFPIVMGEFHPQRYPREYWEEAIMEMKAGGLNVIASYFFWGFVEVRPGRFDFSGSNDFAHYASLCRKHDMLLFARIGPFCNAEILCGGMPPWLFGMPLVERSNDPAYLEFVGRWYAELGKQLEGQYWKDGGPIFMVQVENELGNAPNAWQMIYRFGCSEEHRGPADKDEYIRHYQNLRDLALKSGIDPVVFSMTGWGSETKGIPDEFLVALGGYMYLGKPGKENSGLTGINGIVYGNRSTDKPLAFVELGAAGSPARTQWVPRPPVESAYATALSRLGASNSIMCGWYMYHGGSNPQHPDWGFGSKYDTLSQISYDYNAPLGEYGQARPAYYHLRPLHQTLLNFGHTFSNGAQVYDNPKVKPSEDRLRASIRMGTGESGVACLLHYGNSVPLSERWAALEIKTSAGPLRLPSIGGIRLKNGDFGLLPFNQDLGHGVKLVSATAQLHSSIQNGKDTLTVCSTIRDQPAEFIFELPAGATLTTTGKAEISGGRRRIVIDPGMQAHLSINLADGHCMIFAPIPVAMVRHGVEAVIGGRKRYLISMEDIAVDGDLVRLTSTKAREFGILSYPAVAWKDAGETRKVGFFGSIKRVVKPVTITAAIDRAQPRKWVLKVPATAFENHNDIYADIRFDGLVCRLFDPATGLPVADQLYESDRPWELGLKRFRKQLSGAGLVVVANGVDGDSRRVEAADTMVLDESRTGSRTGVLHSITFRPEYRVWFTGG